MPRLTDLRVEFISLVRRPANGAAIVLKGLCATEGAGLTPRSFSIMKSDDERMVAYGIVYAPDVLDLQGDEASADVIRKAAYDFMAHGRHKNIDVEHSWQEENCYVAESWLVRKGDALFGDQPEGAWAIGLQICDVDIWRKLKSGELTGISLAGSARETYPQAISKADDDHGDQAPGWFQRFLKAAGMAADVPQAPSHTQTLHPDQTPHGDTDMTKDEIATLVTETVTRLMKSAGIAVPAATTAAAPGDAAASATAAPAQAAHAATSADPASAAVADDALASSIEMALSKALPAALSGDAMKRQIEDAVARAVTKGVAESGAPYAAEPADSFA